MYENSRCASEKANRECLHIWLERVGEPVIYINTFYGVFRVSFDDKGYWCCWGRFESTDDGLWRRTSEKDSAVNILTERTISSARLLVCGLPGQRSERFLHGRCGQ